MTTTANNLRPQDKKDDTREYFDEEPEPPFPSQHLQPPGIEGRMSPAPRYEAPYYQASNKLKGCAALITGGDSGIGRSVAVLYAREGADVTFSYLPEESADAEVTLEAIEALGRKAYAVPGDITDANFCKELVRLAYQQYGRLDILVNNAAYQRHQPTIEEVTEEQWQQTFAVNLLAPFRLIKAALPYMKRGSSIINTGSITGTDGNPRLLDYASSKAALHVFGKSLADSLVDRGIRVNTVAPGPVWSPLNPAERSEEETIHFGENSPLGRPAQPEEIAPAYVFLASVADASYISGEVLHILGG